MPAEVGNKLKLFADDSKLYAEVQSEGDAQTLQADLNAITDWADKWQLSFNVDKCKVLHIGKKNTNYVYSMRSGDYVSEIESVQTEKDLGVRFDNELRFSDHINEICRKGFQRICLIRRTFTYKDENMFLTLYKSLLRPVLEYCSTVWSTYYKKDSERIEKVQRKATKLVRTIKDWDYPERLKHFKVT